MRFSEATHDFYLRGFNPRPAVRPGDAFLACAGFVLGFCFTPRPAVRRGDAVLQRDLALRRNVSIRARP